MKLNSKLGLLALASLAVPVLLLAMSYFALRASTEAVEAQYTAEMLPASSLARIDSLIKNSRSHILGGYMHNPANELSKLHAHPLGLHTDYLAKAHGEIESLWAGFTAQARRGDEADLVRAADEGIRLYLDKTLKPSEQALRAGRYDDTIRATTSTFTAIGAAEKAIAELQARAARRAQDTTERSRARERQMMAWSVAVSLAGAAIAAFAIISVRRSLNRSIARIGGIATDLKNHRLARGSETGLATDELGVICRDLDAATESLRDSVREALRTSELVALAASEISAGNADLSSRTEAQASTLQQTASSTQLLAASSRQNSASAQHAAELISTTSEAARRGGELVEGVSRTMSEVMESSRRIVEIISLIDGIAFQTNILALNAAVEAARAGPSGRGFAVVAGEVRNLAHRAAGAASDIKGLINETVTRVESGGRIVADAGQGMRAIVDSVERAAACMREISDASQSQSAGIGQISAAIGEMDGITQHNASLVEQTAAAAENLSRQAAALQSALARFEVGNAA